MQRALSRTCMFFLVLCWFIPTSEPGASGDSESDEPFFLVQVKDDLLTVKVRDVPLKKVLNEIGDQTLIRVIFDALTEEHLSVDFADIPLEIGLRRLTRNFNSVFIYGSEKTNGGEPELKGVVIYGERGTSADTSPKPRKMDAREEKRPSSTDLSRSDMEADVKSLRDEDPVVRKKALDALAESDDNSAILHLGKALVNDQDDDVRASAAEALGSLRDERALVPLVQALRDSNPQVREGAVNGLCQIGGENVMQALKGCLSDKDEALRKIAADALKRLEAAEQAD